jgi:hydroxylaminobenzene mutase
VHDGAVTEPATAGPPGSRHPLDPDPVRSTKAYAVFALGLISALTGAFLGGLVPATVAMLLTRQVRRDASASGGYLTGSAWVRRGERLAWLGVVLAATAVVAALVIGIIRLVGSPLGHDFAPSVN